MSFCKKAALVLSFIIAFSSVSFNTGNVSAAVAPNPVISRNCPVYTNSGSEQEAKYANDEAYFSFWNAQAPAYVAYDLSSTANDQKKEVIAVWYNTTGAFDYSVPDYSSSNGEPSDYTIEVNAAPGGEYPEDGWEVAETVSGNTLHSRQHTVSMDGYNWIRMNITAADGNQSGRSSINFDVHNVSDGISDSWIFYGDSITACGMNNCYGTGFATYVNKIDSRYFPIQENGGIGGIMSSHGVKKIDEWLAVFPGKYVGIAYGTNDSWGNQTGAEKYYENTVYMIEKVIQSGKVPVVPTIPFSKEPGISAYLDDYNAMIQKIYEEYDEVIKGPDFAEFFKENPEYLSGDGVHPSDTGYDQMRQLWAETMYQAVYNSENNDPVEKVLPGDVDGNGSVTAADIVLMCRYLLGQTEKINTQNSDIDTNGVINVIDLIKLKDMML